MTQNFMVIKMADMIDRNFGYLIVKDKSSRKGYWICECVCGDRKEISGNNLRRGHAKSCGCMTNVKDLSGQSFGMLKVLHILKKPGESVRFWMCQCSCGNRTEVRGYDLTRGNTKSCGHLRGYNMKSDGSISYVAAHYRVKSKYGKANSYDCVDCCQPADEWSLRSNVEQFNLTYSFGYEIKFSPNPDDYEPRCISCHRKYDKKKCEVV